MQQMDNWTIHPSIHPYNHCTIHQPIFHPLNYCAIYPSIHLWSLGFQEIQLLFGMVDQLNGGVAKMGMNLLLDSVIDQQWPLHLLVVDCSSWWCQQTVSSVLTETLTALIMLDQCPYAGMILSLVLPIYNGCLGF